MALSPQSNDAFLREVDDELRRDQALQLWRRWGVWLVGGIVLALAALAGFLWWQSSRQAQAGDQGVAFNKALDSLGENKTGEALPTLDRLSKEGGPGYAALARFVQADVALQKDDLKTAAARFADVAGDTKVAQPLRDLALVRQTLAEYETLKPQAVIDRLRPLAVKGNAYFGTAGEMTAVAHLRMNRRDLAGRLYADIAQDEGVPATVRQRAVQMAGVLGVDAIDQAGDKKAG